MGAGTLADGESRGAEPSAGEESLRARTLDSFADGESVVAGPPAGEESVGAWPPRSSEPCRRACT